MDAQSALNIARHGWPSLVGSAASAQPVVDGRLSDHPLWRIDTSQACYALRGWPISELSRAEAAGRFAAHVGRTGGLRVPVPRPTQAGLSTTLQPAGDWLLELAGWLEGESDFAMRPTRERLEAMCRELARLHLQAADLPASDVPLAVDRHLASLTSLLESIQAGEYDQLEPAAVTVECPVGGAWAPALQRGADMAKRQLVAVRAVPLGRQWTWGDAWHNNFLFSGDVVTGLVDFATVRVDTPLADLARLLSSTTAENQVWWPAGLAAYTAVRPLGEGEVRALRALEASGTVLSLANWLRWLGIEHRRFAASQAVCDRMSHFALRLTRLLSGSKTP